MGGVVAHAIDEVGVEAVLEALPQHVEPGLRRDATTLDELDPSGAVLPALSGPGQIFEVVRVR